MNKQEFFDLYAPIAIEQQQKYGIPASVTLAQAALESTWGENVAARESKNFFGIHATKGWQDSGKPTHPYRDNGQMVPFCVYGSAAESFEHHSEFLKQNKRYSECFKLSPTDHRGWAYGICRAGYAARPADNPDAYAKSIEAIIRQNGLEKYDQLGLSPGKRMDYRITQPFNVGGNYSFPLEGVNGQLILTSDRGPRNLNGHKFHQGIDIGVPVGTRVMATEDNGKVIEAGWDSKGGGNYVKVEYNRPDGSNYQIAFLHLSKINVSKGDIVNAGKVVGLSGNTGSSTGPHLDMRIRVNGEYIDPKQYLAEIAVRGGIDTTLVNDKGHDLLAEHKANVTVPTGNTMQGHFADGSDLAKLMEGYVWSDSSGKALQVGEISVCKVSDLLRDAQANATAQGLQWEKMTDKQIEEVAQGYPAEKRDAVIHYGKAIRDKVVDNADNIYVMTAVIDGQQQLRGISQQQYEQFLAADNGQRLSMFDRTFDDVAITTQADMQLRGFDQNIESLMAAFGSGNPMDFISKLRKLNGEGLDIGSGGDLLGEIAGSLISGMLALGAVSEMQKAEEKQISAQIDEKAVALAEKTGIDIEKAKTLVQTNADAGFVEAQAEQQQQQQITMRG